jgi:lysophospholipase L1-like esterase
VIPFSLFDLVLVSAIVLFAASILTFNRISSVPPPNAPKAVLAALGGRRSERPLAVIAGDSITRGAVSANYVDLLAARMPEWDFVNAGVNGDLAYNLAMRLDEIVALDPDAVTVLVGSNDVYASLGLTSAAGYIAAKRLPEQPSPLFFRENLTLILRRLKRETRARVAVLSPPPIGEDPNHYAYLRTEEYALIAHEVAMKENVAYLPLRERLCACIESRTARPAAMLALRQFNAAEIRANRDMSRKGKSLDEISAENGFCILVDGLHLNSRGAGEAADLAEAFLRGAPSS